MFAITLLIGPANVDQSHQQLPSHPRRCLGNHAGQLQDLMEAGITEGACRDELDLSFEQYMFAIPAGRGSSCGGLGIVGGNRQVVPGASHDYERQSYHHGQVSTHDLRVPSMEDLAPATDIECRASGTPRPSSTLMPDGVDVDHFFPYPNLQG